MPDPRLPLVEPGSSLFIHHDLCLRPDPRRVISRPFRPSVEPRDLNPIDRPRVNHIVDRIVALSPEVVEVELAGVLLGFEHRHPAFVELLDTRAAEMEVALQPHPVLGVSRRRLVGAYFLNEYSFEAAALFNPSIVPHPDQSDAPTGGLRFIMSVRGVGEGHISSLTFRSGTMTASGDLSLDPAARLARTPYVRGRTPMPQGEEIDAVFGRDATLSERVIYPITEAQKNGIEDARFVAFDNDGVTTYFATYTAYSGLGIRSELLETRDFQEFRLSPLNGTAARNKGMALFPRKIGGKYAMIGRQDNENIHLSLSDNLYSWDDGQILLRPEYPWEFVQLGNCGAPIDLGDRWLLLTHGVGAMRTYTIGAALLDKDDPCKVIARSKAPLIQSLGAEREGYVPNVVYSCGAMRHGKWLVLPYGVSDLYIRFLTVEIDALVATLMA